MVLKSSIDATLSAGSGNSRNPRPRRSVEGQDMMKRIACIGLALVAPAWATSASAAPQCRLPSGPGWQSGVQGLPATHPIYFVEPEADGAKWSGVHRSWADTEHTLADLGQGKPRASVVLLRSPGMNCDAAKRLQRAIAKDARCGSTTSCALATRADLQKLPKSQRLPHGLD
ncbi:hypothetical protein [Sphingomonas oryzagri]|uniref:Uncharacterized protein n=1 Tax=Sphingomonas oryzagri TaxID=3042314 RepID=A0ABT6N581_9SPHN|nr:hypothetical protein [Sphingomonas oryzagri]MDH7640265.1 hypothetical protein [Sphingomonas oryzagri]